MSDFDGDLTDEQKAQMKEYHLDDLRIEGTNELLGFVCKPGCGIFYVSIEDRMLKAPDDCHGCHNVARWGGL